MSLAGYGGPANPVPLTCRAKQAILLGLIRMHISNVDRMKRASIPGWMVLRQLLQRDITAQAAARLGTLPPPSPTDKPASPVSIVAAPGDRSAFRAVAVRMLWKAVQVLLPASLIGVFLGRRRSVRTLAGLMGTAGALAVCVVLLRDREQPVRNGIDARDPQRAGTGAALQSMEAAMLRIAGELSDPGPERTDHALRA